MSAASLTLQIPEPLFRRLQQRAAATNRTVEAETLDVLAAGVSAVGDELPADVARVVDSLALLDDAALWRAARSHLAADAAARLEDLHLKRQREGLTAAEAQSAADLTGQYERAVLVRARAAALLRQRGHDVVGLTTGGGAAPPPTPPTRP